MTKRIAAFLMLCTVGGCDALPRDPDGTVSRIQQSRTIRVGLTGTEMPPSQARRLIAALAGRNGARVELHHGTLEPMIVDLDANRLDLVIARLAKRTPWKTLVAPGPPLSMRGKGRDRIEWRALMKNGENRWIMQVEAASRDVAPEMS